MAIAFSKRPRLFAGLILLCCWLGCITSTFAALGTREHVDRLDVAASIGALLGLFPAELITAPLAIRLIDSHSPCAQADQQWLQIRTFMDTLNGHAMTLSARPLGQAAPELLVLAADGAAVYAGPIQPATDICGGKPDALARWLPDLLSAATAPLLLPSRCTC